MSQKNKSQFVTSIVMLQDHGQNIWPFCACLFIYRVGLGIIYSSVCVCDQPTNMPAPTAMRQGTKLHEVTRKIND